MTFYFARKMCKPVGEYNEKDVQCYETFSGVLMAASNYLRYHHSDRVVIQEIEVSVGNVIGRELKLEVKDAGFDSMDDYFVVPPKVGRFGRVLVDVTF